MKENDEESDNCSLLSMVGDPDSQTQLTAWNKVVEHDEAFSKPTTGFTKDKINGNGESLLHYVKGIKKILKIAKNEEMNLMTWTDLFKQAFNSNKLNKVDSKKARFLAIKCAKTNPKELEWELGELEDNTLNNAWTAAYYYLGSPWKLAAKPAAKQPAHSIPAVTMEAINKNDNRDQVDAWKRFNNTYNLDGYVGYTEENSLLEDAAIGSDLLGKSKTAIVSIADWKGLFDKALAGIITGEENDRLLSLLASCAFTEPEDITTDSTLEDSTQHNAWAATYILFGSPWKEARKEVGKPKELFPGSGTGKTSKSTDNTPAKTPKKVGFDTTVNPYLSKQLRKPGKTKSKSKDKLSRKYTSICKSRLPKIQGISMEEQEVEFVTIFKKVMQHVWELDNTTILMPWGIDACDKPIKKSSNFPTSKDALREYLSSAWLQKGKNPWVKFILRHNVKIDKFEDEDFQDWFRPNECSFTREKIQPRETKKMGNLLGYHPSATNIRNLTESIESFPQMKDIEIEVRIECFQTQKKEKWDNNNKSPSI